MNILAIDPGTRTGFAARYRGQIESGMMDFSPQRGESKGMRFFRFTRWLMDEMLIKPFDLVIYEMAFHQGMDAKKVMIGMITRIEEICARRNIEYTNLPATKLKKWATKDGRASKERMIEEAKGRYPDHEIEADDQADALLLLSYAMERFK